MKQHNFNNIAKTNNFKFFKYKAKLLKNAVAHLVPNATNGILRNATIALLLRYLSNFWRSLKIPLINCNVELKLKWAKYIFFSAGSTENVINEDANANNIIFTIKEQLYVPVVFLSAGDNKNYQNFMVKDLKDILLEWI